MATLLDAIKITRALLNDDDGLTWADHLIIPKVGQAWGEILAKFQLNGVPVVKDEVSNPILIAALATSVTAPTDMDYPIKMEEYGASETIDNAIPMTQKDFIPNVEKETTLRYWSYLQQQILLLGATTPRNVLLYYIKNLAAPKRLADVLTINQAEIYIGPRLASIIFASKGQMNQAQASAQVAEANMSLVLRAQVKRMQSLPVRRRPFSYQVKRRNRFSI